MDTAKKIKLNNGFELPLIGMGTYTDKKKLEEAVKAAKESGCVLYDASEDYHNEKELGDALENNYSATDELVVITKMSFPNEIHYIDEYFEQRKKILMHGRRNPDIFLLHWPYPHMYKKMWKCLEEKYRKGECKAIGVCNFKQEHLEKLMKSCTIKPMINQFELHPLYYRKELCDYCKENGIAVMSYSPFARMDSKLVNSPVMTALSEKYGKTVSQIVVRWNYQHEFSVIPASSKDAHIRANFEVLDFELTDEEMAQIDGMNENYRMRFDADTYFSEKTKMKFFLQRNKTIYRIGKKAKSILKRK